MHAYGTRIASIIAGPQDGHSPPHPTTMSPVSLLLISPFAFIVFIADVAAVNASLTWDRTGCSEGIGSWEVSQN